MKDIMNRIALSLAAALLAAPALAGLTSISPVPQSTSGGNWWYQRFLEKSAYLQANGCPVLLVGDSITELWEVEGRGKSILTGYLQKKPYNAYVVGYSADKTENVLWRMQNGELTGYQPEIVVLAVGTNNTWHRNEDQEPPCDTVLGIRACITEIQSRAPKAKIILCAIPPCGRSVKDERRIRNAVVNDAIRELCDGERVAWCEINNQIMNPDGYYPEDVSYDGVHPTTEGYRIWARNLLPFFDQVMKPDPTPALQRPLSRMGEEWWLQRLLDTRIQAYSVRSNRPNIVFFGDDLAEGWETQGMAAITNCFGNRTFANAGISGDALPQLIWRAKYASLGGFRTYHLVIQAGLVDSGTTPEEFLEAYKVMVAAARTSQVHPVIYLMAVPPRGETADDPQRARIAAINAGIAELADGDSVVYIDCNSQLLEADGSLSKEMSPDAIHFTDRAYAIWAEALKPYIMK